MLALKCNPKSTIINGALLNVELELARKIIQSESHTVGSRSSRWQCSGRILGQSLGVVRHFGLRRCFSGTLWAPFPSDAPKY